MTEVWLNDALDVLWQEWHTRLGASDNDVVSLNVGALQGDAAVALQELLRIDRPPPRSVRTDALLDALRCDLDELETALEGRYGPIGNRAARAAAAKAARQAAARRLRTSAGADPQLADWAAAQARGTGQQLEEAERLAALVLRVVTDPPASMTPLPILAAQVFGDPHALDPATRAGRMLTAALAASAGTEAVGARSRRRLLRDVNVLADELSSTVAARRLPLPAHHPLAVASGDTAVPLTLAQLLTNPLTVDTPCEVRMVENPSVLAQATLDDIGLAMLCTSGLPSVAALEAVEQLVEAGCTVWAHADFDGNGLRTVSTLIDAGARPWAMDIGTYLRAAARSKVPLTTWDDPDWAGDLPAQMRATGRVGFEEHLLDVLLAH